MSKESFKDKLKRRAAENREEFRGMYGVQIRELMGLSESEINAIRPTTADKEAYDQLMMVVQEASAQNLSQAELKQRITEMGAIAVSIAQKVPSLAAMLL